MEGLIFSLAVFINADSNSIIKIINVKEGKKKDEMRGTKFLFEGGTSFCTYH